MSKKKKNNELLILVDHSKPNGLPTINGDAAGWRLITSSMLPINREYYIWTPRNVEFTPFIRVKKLQENDLYVDFEWIANVPEE